MLKCTHRQKIHPARYSKSNIFRRKSAYYTASFPKNMLRDLGVRRRVVFVESYQISTMKHHTGSASLLVAVVELSLEPILLVYIIWRPHVAFIERSPLFFAVLSFSFTIGGKFLGCITGFHYTGGRHVKIGEIFTDWGHLDILMVQLFNVV